MKPREAAIKAMSEVSGPVVATTLVLLAVFVPSAFLPGITGEMYRQFALTIAVATVFSTINALTLSPALSALLLRPQTGKKNAFFRGLRRGLRQDRSGIHGALQVPAAARRTGHAAVRRAVGPDRLAVRGPADRLPARGGSGLRDGRRSASRRRLLGAYARGAGRDRRDSRSDARGSGLGLPRRLLADRRHQRLQRGHRVHHHGALGGANGPGVEPGGDPDQPAAPVCRHPGGHRFRFHPPPAISGLGVAGGFPVPARGPWRRRAERTGARPLRRSSPTATPSPA